MSTAFQYNLPMIQNDTGIADCYVNSLSALDRKSAFLISKDGLTISSLHLV